jgi:hypothetical protein
MQEVCPCHGEPWYVVPSGRRCSVRRKAAKRKYQASPKTAAKNRRYYYEQEGREKQSIRRAGITIAKFEQELDELRKGRGQ